MAGFGGKAKRDAPEGQSIAPPSRGRGLIAQDDRAVRGQARPPVAPGAGFDSSSRSSCPARPPAHDSRHRTQPRPNQPPPASGGVTFIYRKTSKVDNVCFGEQVHGSLPGQQGERRPRSADRLVLDRRQCPIDGWGVDFPARDHNLSSTYCSGVARFGCEHVSAPGCVEVQHQTTMDLRFTPIVNGPACRPATGSHLT
jgi:hypothetical protein